MNIIESSQRYEEWLERQLGAVGLPIDRPALAVKHAAMADSSYSYFRSTYYRWIELWPSLEQRGIPAAPLVISVGDLHAENFGTWRDAEGRLVWGVNDLDEAGPLPYMNDLVRLATSVQLADAEDHCLKAGPGVACREILNGYRKTLSGGKAKAGPLVLSEENDWLREIAVEQVREPAKFWAKLENSTKRGPAGKGKNKRREASVHATPAPPAREREEAEGEEAEGEDVPNEPRTLLEKTLPDGTRDVVVSRRQAGLGSLGKPRFAAVGRWQGARVAREAKVLLPTATMARPELAGGTDVDTILHRAVRSDDPFYRVSGNWLVRRLSPDCTKLELAEVPRGLEQQYLFAMGREIANIHLGTGDTAAEILMHLECLEKSRENWLEDMADESAARAREDRHDWRARYVVHGVDGKKRG